MFYMGVVFELCTCTEIIALISDLRSKIDYSRIFFFKTASPFSINKKTAIGVEALVEFIGHPILSINLKKV